MPLTADAQRVLIPFAALAVAIVTIGCAHGTSIGTPDCSTWNSREFFETASVADVATCVQGGGDIHRRGEHGNTPLHFAAGYAANPRVLDKLIGAGLGANAPNYNGTKPLHYAVGFNDDPAFITILLSAGADLEGRNGIGFTPLHFATANNENPVMLTALLSAGADLHSEHGLRGTALHVAAAFNANPEVAQILIDAGLDPSAVNRSGLPPAQRRYQRKPGNYRGSAGSRCRCQRNAPG